MSLLKVMSNPMPSQEPKQRGDPQAQPEEASDHNDLIGSVFGPRSRPGLALFLGGAGFLLYSVGLTRRALARQRRLAVPKYYVWNNAPPPKTNGLPAAVEALLLATINVCSLAITLTGGWMWSLQVRNMEDLRWRLRSRIGGGARPGTASKPEVEEEIEEWIAKILARRAEKEKSRRSSNLWEPPKD